jgi:DNA replication protein DnaC
MDLYELWKHFRLLSDTDGYSPEEREFLGKFLTREYALKEQKKREHLLRMSGIKRVKLLSDFNWAFNPKIPREKVMEFMQTDWLQKPCNLVLIGPSGVGKSHVASALCYDEVGYVMPTREHADYLFQIVSKRVEMGTTIVTTNLIPSQWGKVFDSTTASAILDRLSMNGTFLTFEGKSYRNRKGE